MARHRPASRLAAAKSSPLAAGFSRELRKQRKIFSIIETQLAPLALFAAICIRCFLSGRSQLDDRRGDKIQLFMGGPERGCYYFWRICLGKNKSEILVTFR